MPQAAAPLNGPNKDGGLVVTQTSGSGKGNIYLVLQKYQFILTGAYQAKWDINLGLNWVMRQGYALPYYRSQAPGSAGSRVVCGKPPHASVIALAFLPVLRRTQTLSV